MTSDHAARSTRVLAREKRPDGLRAYGLTVLLLAGVLLFNSLLGPLVLGAVSYPITETVENQLIGLELVTALLVVPWAVIAGLAALMGRPAAPIFGFAPSAYAAYMFVQYVLGPEYARYSLTSLAHLGIFVLSAGLMVWSIFLLDLGIVVPCTVAAGFALLRGRAAGQRALYSAVGWFALVPPSVAAMAVVMWARNDPNASMPTVLLLSVASLAFGAFAWCTLHPLLTSPTGPDHYERNDR
jgi:hypothetical protein